MSIRERIFDRFFGDIHEQRTAAKLEALRAATGRSTADAGWRRLTDSPDRDLLPVTFERQREIAVYLWTYNPIARRILETIVEWVVGEGVQIQAKNPATAEYLKRFWDHPVNRWDLKLPMRTRELFLFGEQFWPAFQNQFSGLISLAAMDPARVKAVVPDPDNAETVVGVVTSSREGQEERRLRTILRGDEMEILSDAALRERERFTDGELFVAQVNKLSAQTRGTSELFALADWLDGYEQLLFGILQQEKARSQYIWDLELQGATEEQIQERLQTLRPPRPLSVRVHNEKEKWTLVGPDAGGAAANTEHARLFRNHVLGGGAIPEHWYGGGGDVNRATAAEMGAPTEKAMTARQKVIKYLLEDVLAVQIERGIEARVLREAEDVRDVSVTLPDLSTRDISRVAQALQQVSAALMAGQTAGWVDDDVAAQVLSSMIAHLGVEVDAEEMLDRARTSLVDQVTRDFERRRPRSAAS